MAEEKSKGKMRRREVGPKTEMGYITGLCTSNLYLPYLELSFLAADTQTYTQKADVKYYIGNKIA